MAANSDVIRKLQSIHGDDVVRELLNSMDELLSQRCTWPVAADLGATARRVEFRNSRTKYFAKSGSAPPNACTSRTYVGTDGLEYGAGGPRIKVKSSQACTSRDSFLK